MDAYDRLQVSGGAERMYRTHPERKGAMNIVFFLFGVLVIAACVLTMPAVAAVMRWEATDKQVRYEYRAPINRSERVVIPAHPHRIRTTALWFFVELLSIVLSVIVWRFGIPWGAEDVTVAAGVAALGMLMFTLMLPVTTLAVLDEISQAQRKRA